MCINLPNLYNGSIFYNYLLFFPPAWENWGPDCKTTCPKSRGEAGKWNNQDADPVDGIWEAFK